MQNLHKCGLFCSVCTMRLHDRIKRAFSDNMEVLTIHNLEFAYKSRCVRTSSRKYPCGVILESDY